jgi:hypothetical protein
LLVVGESEREAIVAAIEKRVVETYGIARDYPDPNDAQLPEVTVVHPPIQREGYVEQIETTYGSAARPDRRPTPKQKPTARKRRS